MPFNLGIPLWKADQSVCEIKESSAACVRTKDWQQLGANVHRGAHTTTAHSQTVPRAAENKGEKAVQTSTWA